MAILDLFKEGITSSSPAETVNLGVHMAKLLPEDHVLALHGDLGVGKTTFVKGMARFWNIKETITSPTFNIYTIYKGQRNLIHLDAYRLSSEKDLENILLEEFLISPYCLVVEWPKKIESILPSNTWHVHLSIAKDRTHFVKLR